MGISIPRWYPINGQPEILQEVSKRDAWVELRSMRAHPPCPDGRTARADVFRTSLEQSEQLFRAAEQTGNESRPLLLFYGLSQAGRAIAAASQKLGDHEWALSGHGIRAAGLNGSVENIAVSNHGLLAPGKNPSFLRVAQALASPSIPTKVKVRELWYLLPELRGQLNISRSAPRPTLFMEDAHLVGKTSATALIWGLPHDFSHEIGFAGMREYGSEAESQVVKYLADYPTLTNYRFARVQPSLSSGRTAREIEWSDKPRIELAHDGGVQVAIELEERLSVSEYGFNRPSEFPRNVMLRRASFVYPSLGVRAVFPAIAENIEALHPLIAWWAVLYGLSMLARYEPSSWTEAISVNRSSHAIILEILLDEAINACPPLILQSLKSSL
ncbi:YaaC family protein [Streptomyces sp. NPDC088341]|uniref:YaaC family protein n=1 Tax=Streptomyces sp. NPDC088341 TaxID=3154870 RepID=UPI003438910C